MGRRKINSTTEALAKSNDILDMASIVKEVRNEEVVIASQAKKAIAEIAEIQVTPDMPKRWGNRGPLTAASPGNIVEDFTYIPEHVTLQTGGTRHIVNRRVIDGQLHTLTKDSQRKMRWCRQDKIKLHQRRGFKFSSYKDMFRDTGLFSEGPGDTIQNGDLILMEIYLDGWEKMRDEKLRLQAALEGAIGNELFAEGTKRGVPTFKDDMKTGVRNYYT